MKKNLFYLFALICSMGLFTACSSDDEPTWKQLSSQEISAENLSLTTNSQSFPKASVKLAMTGAQNGVLTLNKAIRGLDEVEVNVTLAEQTDGSFKFQGEKNIATATKAMTDLVSSTTVKVAGTITLAGKAEVVVSTEAVGGLVKKWMLCDNLYFADIQDPEHPEDPEAKIKIKHAPVHWNWVSTYISEGYEEDPGHATDNVSLVGGSSLSCIMVKLLKDVEFKANGSIVANYAKDVEINQDEIIGGAMGFGLPSTENVSWLTSPANLAYWYVDGNRIRVVLDIPAIVTEAMKDSENSTMTPESILGMLETIQGLNGAKIKELLGGFLANMGSDNILSKLDLTAISDADVEKLVGYLVDGFPLGYEVSDVTLSDNSKIKNVYVYLDKDILDVLIPTLFPALPELDKLVKSIIVELYGTPAPIWGLVEGLTGMKSLTELQPIWKSTTRFNLGLDLASGSYKVEK